MKPSLVFSLVFLGITLSQTAHAESAEELLSACKAVSGAAVAGESVALPRDFNAGLCWGAFATIQKVIKHVAREGQDPFYGVCTPPESTRTQLIAIFVRYAPENPSRLHEDFFDVALSSLRVAFPCGRRPK